MAIPPKPLRDVLPNVVAIVDAEVVKVLSTDDPPEQPTHEEGATSVGFKVARQMVVLKINEVLKGPLRTGTQLSVVKPEAAYALRAGNHGPFLLDGQQPPAIVGAYGPDSYSFAALRAALSSER
jgi:hypothetical protein